MPLLMARAAVKAANDAARAPLFVPLRAHVAACATPVFAVIVTSDVGTGWVRVGVAAGAAALLVALMENWILVKSGIRAPARIRLVAAAAKNAVLSAAAFAALIALYKVRMAGPTPVWVELVPISAVTGKAALAAVNVAQAVRILRMPVWEAEVDDSATDWM